MAKGRDTNYDTPARRQSTPLERKPRFNGAQFVQYELDKAQQAECKAWTVTGEELWSEIQAQIDDGYKFTLKEDTYNECYGVFMQPSTDSGPNSGSILTGRGSTIGKALKQVIYKHRVCLQGDWSAYLERRGRDLIDD